MASEIQVQTISGPPTGANANKVIIPAGQTLSVADGVQASDMPAGSVVQTAVKTSDTVVTQTSSALIGFGLSLAFTPKFVGSKILIIASIAGEHYGYSDLGIRYDLIQDGSQVRYWPYVDYHSADDSQNISIQTLQWQTTAASTNSTTFEFRFQPSNGSGTGRVNNYNSPSHMTIMEIKQ
jgi:hypothetical protein